MPVANNRLLTDDTGLALVDAIERIAPLQIAPLVVSIPTGQWSGSGNDYYISVSASNVTANSILVPNYDKESAAYLKGPVWCVPAAGSFTIHTNIVPSGTVNIMVQFPGTMGEANYQVLADVYSKSQTYSKTEAVAKADIVNNLISTATDKPLSAAQGKALNDKLIPTQITLTNLHSSISNFSHVLAYKIGDYVDINGYFITNTEISNNTTLFNSPYKPLWLHIGYIDQSGSVGAFYPIYCSDASGNVVTNCGSLPAGSYDINIHFICK